MLAELYKQSSVGVVWLERTAPCYIRRLFVEIASLRNASLDGPVTHLSLNKLAVCCPRYISRNSHCSTTPSLASLIMKSKFHPLFIHILCTFVSYVFCRLTNVLNDSQSNCFPFVIFAILNLFTCLTRDIIYFNDHKEV